MPTMTLWSAVAMLASAPTTPPPGTSPPAVVEAAAPATAAGEAAPAGSRLATPGPQAPARTPADVEQHDDAEALTLAELFDLLRTDAPRHKAAVAQLQVAQARKVGARVLPNPVFNFQVLHLISGYNQNGFGTYSVYFQQPLLIGGQRAQRSRAARAAERAAHSEIAAEFHELAAQGRHAFVALQARQRHREVLVTAIADLERVEAMVTGRHAAGAESRYDVTRIGLSVRQWRAQTITADAEIRDVAGQLGVLVGRPHWHPRAEGAFEPLGIAADARSLWPDVQRSQPSLRAARDRERLAERDLKATRREVWPQPTIGFGVVGIDNFFSMSVLGGVVMPMPIFDWGQGPVAKATAELHVAKVQREASTAELQAELERVAAVLRERRRALAGFESDVLSQTTELQQMAEDAYVTGQVEILELIDAVEAHYELELQHVDLEEHVMHAEIDVLHVVGRVEETR